MKNNDESDIIYFKLVVVLLLGAASLVIFPSCRGKAVKPNDSIEHRK